MKITSQLKQGFTLTEVMVSVSIGMLAMAGFLTVFITFLSHSEAATVWRDADNNASMAIERMVRGTETTLGLREFHDGDIENPPIAGGWTIYDNKVDQGFIYSEANQTISDFKGNVFIKNVTRSTIEHTDEQLIELSISIKSGTGKYVTTREFNATLHPRNL